MENDLNIRIDGIKLLEKFHAVLSNPMYEDDEFAWMFLGILKDIIYKDSPTKERGELVRVLPPYDLHFTSKTLLSAISHIINDLAKISIADDAFRQKLKKLLS
jgi:hypothetical protein